MRSFSRYMPLGAGFLLLPLPASAHLVSTGLGPLYDGITHLALTPEEVLPMAALALFAGLRGPTHARRLLFLFPVAWLTGCLAVVTLPANLPPLATAIVVMVAGALLASDLKLPPIATAAIAILFGLALGELYGTPVGDGGAEPLAALGAGGCVFVFVALLASVSLPLRALPARIAVRVGGSWTAALGLLLVGWWIHGRA